VQGLRMNSKHLSTDGERKKRHDQDSVLKKGKRTHKIRHRSENVPGIPRLPGTFQEVWEHRQTQTNNHTDRGRKASKPALASLEATFGMGTTSTTLMAATPPRPGEDPTHGRRGRPDQSSEQTTHFGNGQGARRKFSGRARGGRSTRSTRSTGGATLRCTNPCQIGMCQQDQRDVYVIRNRSEAHYSRITYIIRTMTKEYSE
jgi:hypothetical protein